MIDSGDRKVCRMRRAKIGRGIRRVFSLVPCFGGQVGRWRWIDGGRGPGEWSSEEEEDKRWMVE